MTEKGTSGEAGSEIVSGTVGGAATTGAGISLGAAAGTITNNSITNATSGIGIIKTLGTAALKLEIEALQSLGKTKITKDGGHIKIPKTLDLLNPIISVIPMQLISYYTALLKGTDVDKPRNLAKSVTVE